MIEALKFFVLNHKMVTSVLIISSICGCTAIMSKHSGEYIGISYKQAVVTNGKPVSEQSLFFSRTNMLRDYQYNLYDALTGENNIKLIEVWWKSENQTIIIWFRTQGDSLTAVDSRRYKKN